MRFTACVFIKGPENKVVTVEDKKHKIPLSKYPGGKSKKGESPEDCILREVLEETGLSIGKKHLLLVEKIDRGNHFLYFFKISVRTFSGLKEIGKTREKVGLCDISQIKTKEGFLGLHREISIRNNLI